MRKVLRDLKRKRRRFSATAVRYGYDLHGNPTLLIEDVRDHCDRPMTDHMWLLMNGALEAARLEPGEVFRFEARILRYRKRAGTREERIFHPGRPDYQLADLSRIRRLMQSESNERRQRRR